MKELLEEIEKKREDGATHYYCYRDLSELEQVQVGAKGYRLYPQHGKDYKFIIRW